MKGFFSNYELQSKSAKARVSKHPGCAKCKLHKECNSPKMPVHGKGKKKILIMAEAPGAQEDLRGEQLVGKAGKFLARKLKRLFDIDMNRDCWKMNALNCRPPDNRDPKAYEIECCRPYVLDTIDRLQPHVIIPFGSHSIKSLIGHRWKKELGTISKWRGFAIPDKEINAWICPTFHPSYIQRQTTPEVAEVIFGQDLERAINKIDEPIPDGNFDHDMKCVDVLKHPEQVDTFLQHLILGPTKYVAFDYEGTGLKPQPDEQEIVSCAIADARDHATSFPLFDENLPLFKRFLAADHLWKIAHNMKFEEIWSREKLNAQVNSWLFCTQLASHIDDNRPKITSLKFQTYVRYGICDYDGDISWYLKSKDGTGNGLNRIKELPLSDILLYGGLDTLYTFRIAEDLMDDLGGVTNMHDECPF